MTQETPCGAQIKVDTAENNVLSHGLQEGIRPTVAGVLPKCLGGAERGQARDQEGVGFPGHRSDDLDETTWESGSLGEGVLGTDGQGKLQKERQKDTDRIGKKRKMRKGQR